MQTHPTTWGRDFYDSETADSSTEIVCDSIRI